MVGQPATAPLGSFTYDPATDHWTWSDELFVMHGFVPGEIVPTTALVESHRHPDDRAGVRALVDEALATGRPGACQHRLVDAAGHEHWVALVVEPRPSPEGPVLEGRVVDLTVAHTRSSAEQANAMLEAATESRTVIDEAKGVLMLVYGMGHDAAFELLRWYSQHTNLKLRTLAERVVEAAPDRLRLPEQVRRDLDEVLHEVTLGTAPQRPRPEVVPARTPPADGPGVALTTHEVRLPGATFLRVSGEVDLHSAPQLAAALTEAVGATRSPAPVVVDLSDVTHLGPAGVAELLACHRRCETGGTGLRVVVGPDGPSVPVDAGGLAVFDDLASAAA